MTTLSVVFSLAEPKAAWQQQLQKSFNENRRGRRNKNGLIRWAPSIIIFLTYLVNINSFQRNYDLESKKTDEIGSWILRNSLCLRSAVVRTTQNNNKIVVKLLWKYFRVKKFESFLCLRELIQIFSSCINIIMTAIMIKERQNFWTAIIEHVTHYCCIPGFPVTQKIV